MKMKTIQMVDVDEWDKLVQNTYGKPYSFQQQDGCKDRGTKYITVPEDEYDYKNDSITEMVNGPEEGVSFQAWLDRDPNEIMKDEPKEENSNWELRLFWDRNFYPHVSMIVNDLHKQGLLEAGEFAINIDW